MLLKSYPSFTIQDDEWVDLNTLLSIPVGTSLGISNSGAKGCYVYINTTPPISNTDGYLITEVGDSSQSLQLSEGVETVWVRGKGCRLNTYLISGGSPVGLYEGTRAITVQGYEEANIKLGVQFEGSKNFGDVAAGAEINTIFRTGNLPISLKRRMVSFTGVGITGSVYQNPIFTGGTPEDYQNATTVSPETGLVTILTGITELVDDGELVFAPVHAFGNSSNQGKGGLLTLLEPEHILAPNTDFLFRIKSIDTGVQKIASHLVWYQGNLDLPRP